MFFCVIAYFIYQLFLCYKEKNINKRITGFCIGITLLILSLATWPFYLNFHLVLGIVTVLYAIGIFNEWLRHGKKEKNDLYILTAGLLGVLAGFQFVEYFYFVR